MIHPTFIQWNCRGFRVNFNELSLLIQQQNPIAICLQETHLKETDKINIKHYAMYNHYAQTDRASGGSSIAVHSNYIHSEINLKTNLQAIAIRLSLDKTITLCSVYIPPNHQVQTQELTNLIQQLPAPFILMGDFNAHNPLWGSDKITDKGKKLEDAISHHNLCILNDGSKTYLHPGNGSYSSIDISIVDPSLLLDLNWSVHDDLCGSDHFSIIIKGNDPAENSPVKNWKLDKADWSFFENLCLQELTVENFENHPDPIQKFTETLLQIANKCIPKTSTNSTKIKKPWFTDECDEAIKARKKAERLFNRLPTSLNLDNFRIYRAKARRTINLSKRKSWKTFVSNLNSHTPINKVWNAIRKIKRKGSGKKHEYTSPLEIKLSQTRKTYAIH